MKRMRGECLFQLLSGIFISACLLLCTNFCLAADEAAKGNTLSKEVPIEIVYLQQNRGRIALSYSENDTSDIYVIDFESQKVLPLVASDSRESNPRWSHDGKYLAFDSDASGQSGIYVLSMTDPEKKPRLLAEYAGAQQPDWSPDDAYLVFSVRNSKDRGRSLYIVDTMGQHVRRLHRGKSSITNPRWSPRGTEIVYSSNHSWPGWDLVLLDVNTKRTKTLTKGVQNFVRASWFPDGGSLLFSYGSAREFNIWKLEKGSSEVKELLALPGRMFDAELGISAQTLFFVAEDSPGSGHYELFVYDLRSETLSQVTRSKGSIRDISWTRLPLPPVAPAVPDVAADGQEDADASK